MAGEHYEVRDARAMVAELRSKLETANPEEKLTLVQDIERAEKFLDHTIWARSVKQPSKDSFITDANKDSLGSLDSVRESAY